MKEVTFIRKWERCIPTGKRFVLECRSISIICISVFCRLVLQVGARELSLNFMKGARPHVGFPESAYAKYADLLVQSGYKVARVEQTETPKELAARNQKEALAAKKKGKKFVKHKAVNREVCSILTPGTLVEEEVLGGPDSAFLLSLCETKLSEEVRPSTEKGSQAFIPVVTYGVCYVDTSTGTFTVGQFQDEKHRSKLRTLLAQLQPEELLFPKDKLSVGTLNAIRREVPTRTV